MNWFTPIPPARCLVSSPRNDMEKTDEGPQSHPCRPSPHFRHEVPKVPFETKQSEKKRSDLVHSASDIPPSSSKWTFTTTSCRFRKNQACCVTSGTNTPTTSLFCIDFTQTRICHPRTHSIFAFGPASKRKPPKQRALLFLTEAARLAPLKESPSLSGGPSDRYGTTWNNTKAGFLLTWRSAC